jgi:FKBP-type peptidyl-prolyl cis-trans isomerase
MLRRLTPWLLVTALVTGCASEAPKEDAPVLKPIPAPADVAAPPTDAQVTASGLASKVLSPGTGTRHPRPNSRVTVHYTGWMTNGEMFDSSVSRNEPATFGLYEVISGWTEGVQMMVEGEKRRFWIPSKLAYGDSGKIRGTLVFDVELIKIDN